MKKRVNIFLLSFLFVFFCSVNNAFAQKQPPQPPPSGKSALTPNPGLPINGGILYMLASGILYGVYELRKKK